MSTYVLREADLVFTDGSKFTIVHDFPDTFGLSIENALESWLARTDDYTVESFVEYVRDKNTGFMIFSKAEYDKHLQDFNNLQKKKNPSEEG